MNLEGGQLFCLTESKFLHEWSGYFHQHFFSLEVVAVLMLIHPCHDMSGIIVGTEKDEENFNFTFLIGAGMSG